MRRLREGFFGAVTVLEGCVGKRAFYGAQNMMDANSRWEYALEQPGVEPKRSKKKSVRLEGGRLWRDGARPQPPRAGDKYDDDAVASRSLLRAISVVCPALEPQSFTRHDSERPTLGYLV